MSPRLRRTLVCLPLLLGAVASLPACGARSVFADRPPPVELRRAVSGGEDEGSRLFDAERWSEAAPLLKRVVDGETGADEGHKQIAELHLAICLYRLQLYQASFGIFSAIADKPSHPGYGETLLWLSKLATELPEPADLVERVGKYPADQIARFDNPEQRDLYWQLDALLGRYRYRRRSFEEAISLLDKVDPKSGVFAEAQFVRGMAYVMLRKSVPAVKSFQAIVSRLEESTDGAPDAARMRDLANLSMARTYYSASVQLDEHHVPTIDANKLSAAVKYWSRVDAAGAYGLDALFESSWGYFMAGDFSHALGNLEQLESPSSHASFYPEADNLRAAISFARGQYEDASAIATRMKKRYEPIKQELEAFLDRYKGEGGEQKLFELLRDVRAGKASLSSTVRPVLERALSDRDLLHNLEYVRALDEEGARFQKAPASFRDAPIGNDVTSALNAAHDLAIHNAGTLARARCQRALDELGEHLRDASSLLSDIASAERNKRGPQAVSGQPVRATQFRPRTSFVPELLQSVENLR